MFEVRSGALAHGPPGPEFPVGTRTEPLRGAPVSPWTGHILPVHSPAQRSCQFILVGAEGCREVSKLQRPTAEPEVDPAESGVQPGIPLRAAQPASPEHQRPRLLDRVREAVRTRRYSLATEKAYVGWIRRYILFHNKRHPAEMGEQELSRFLTHLAVRARVSASTQNQALAALLFLYGEVLEREVPWLDEIVRAKRPRHLPVVLTRQQ